MRIPSDGDYRNYDGAHCFRLWKQLSDDWQCPGCGRTKRQIMRWTLRTPNGRRFRGWMAGLHTHHDYSQGFVEAGRGRFHKIIICDQCNSADGLAKRKLRLPSNFSFSAGEIRQFVTSTPHGKHEIDTEKARQIYKASSRLTCRCS